MAYWSTVILYNHLPLSKAAQLHVSQTLAVFHLRSYRVKAHAIHRFTHSRIRRLLECSRIISTITTGVVIRVCRKEPERYQ